VAPLARHPRGGQWGCKGVAEPPPWPVWGGHAWFGHPMGKPFGRPGGGWATTKDQSPWFFFSCHGVAEPPLPWAMGIVRPPPDRPSRGWLNYPCGPWSGSATPKGQNPIFFCHGVVQPPPFSQRVAQPPPLLFFSFFFLKKVFNIF
jgi:hypothetical protein